MPERSVWPLMEVVEQHFDEPWLAPLADHIRNAGATRDEVAPGTPEPLERFSIVRHVADLFDRYAVHRPDMVQRWAEGAPHPDEAGLAGRALAPPARPHRQAEPGGAPGERLRQAAGRARPAGPPAPAVVVRPDPPAGELPRRPRRHRRRHAPSTSSCSTRRPRSGSASSRTSVPRRGTCPAGRTGLRRTRATRCSHRGAATPARCNWFSAVRETHGDEATEAAARGRAHPAAADPGRRPGRPCAGVDRGRRGRRRRRSPVAGARRRQHPGPFLSRPQPAGRGPARRRPASAGGGPGARGARHHRHVPRHRALRAAHSGDLRRARRGGWSRRRHAAARDPPGRPLPPPDQPGDGRPGRGARPRHRADDGEPGPRSRRARAGAAAIPLHR